MTTAQIPELRPRPYQAEAAEACISLANSGVHRMLTVIPTGTGKTPTMVLTERKFLPSGDDVTLVLAHTDELIGQLQDTFSRFSPHRVVAREQADLEAPFLSQVVVGSVQTLQGDRLERFLKKFGSRLRLTFIDEAHHAPAASYRVILARSDEWAPDQHVVGFTASGRRSDGIALGSVFEQVAYYMGLDEAFEQGWLVPPRVFTVSSEVVVDDALEAGDDEQLGEILNNVRRNTEIIDAWRRHANGTRTFVFAASLAHARSLAAAFRAIGIKSETIDGTLSIDTRRARMNAFAEGEVPVLCAYNAVNEGVDVDGVETIILARTTESQVILEQQFGRGLRPLRAIAGQLGDLATAEERRALIRKSAKPFVRVLDVVDIAHRLKLATVPSLFGLAPSPLRSADPVEQLREAREQTRKLAESEHEQKKKLVAVELDLFDRMLPTITTTIEETQIERIAALPSEVQEGSYAWYAVLDGVYRLNLPPLWRAVDEDGRGIRGFSARMRRALAEAEKAHSNDPLADAYRMLRVNPSQVSLLEFALEVRVDPLGTCVVRCERGENTVTIGRAPSLGEAVMRAEAWVRANYPDVAELVGRDERWRSAPPTRRQRADLLGLGVSDVPATAGDASILLGRLRASAA